MKMRSILQRSVSCIKTTFHSIQGNFLTVGVIFSVFVTSGQDVILDAAILQAATGKYESIGRDGNSQTWQKITLETNELKVLAKTNSYVEVATGRAHFINGQWLDSSDQIQIIRTGAQATNTQHKVEFLGHINSVGAIRLTLPEGDRHLVSTPIGISYFDTASGKSVMIAELKDSVGELLLSGNQVLYQDAFTDFSADLLYINSISSFEQLVVFREQPPSPEEWGLDPETTLLQVITEFFDPPVPQVTERIVSGMPDEYLSFGVTHMPKGYAFALGDEANTIPVTKQWLALDGRQCLIESAPFNKLAPVLDELPRPINQAGRRSADPALNKVASRHLLPSRKYVNKDNTRLQVASVAPSSKGVAVDYTTLTTQNLVFQGDTTYYVNGNVNIAGTLTVEGNTVVKFTNTTPASIITTNVIWSTASFRPAIFTSKNDDSVGEQISGSTGNPATNFCGGIALNMSSGFGDLTISNAHFAYLSNVVAGVNGNSLTFNNVQFNQCYTLLSTSDKVCYFRNCLLYNLNTIQAGCGGSCDLASVHMENVTMHTCTNFSSNLSTMGGTVWLTNSLLVNVTNLSGPSATIYTNHSYVIYGDSGIFQTVAAAAHLLATNSPYRDVGTTNIDSSLLAELRLRTTYPPMVYSNLTLTVNTTLSPQAQRDVDTPDIGYHYFPLDFITHLLVVTNCALTVTPGTSIACYNNLGFWPQEGSSISSTGTPTAPIYYLRYQAVQELSTSLGGSPSSGFGIDPYHTSTPEPTAIFRFTRFSCPAGGGSHFYNQSATFGSLVLQDSEVWGGANKFGGWVNTTITLQNNLFNRGSYDSVSVYTNTLSVSNNLFWTTTSMRFFSVNTNFWYVYNNLFDSCTFFASPGTVANSGCNAYYNCNPRLSPTNANDITLASAVIYKSGPLGDYYRTNSGSLINSGSCNANVNGLYHYTVATNLVSSLQVKETNSVVDIGYHYVAVNSSGQPIDTDNDGSPDYFEDSNGNGSINSGETDWNNGSDLGLRIMITRPKNNSSAIP